jgi:hypothetical protein
MTPRDRALKIMCDSFDSNPAVLYSIGNKRAYQFRKRHLAAFMYDFCQARMGVRFSSDGHGIICFYHSQAKVNFLRNLYDELCLALFAVGPFRLGSVLRRTKAIRAAQVPKDAFIHCWYLGVESEHRHYTAAAELRDILYQTSAEWNLPILAETMIDQNKRVYLRMGFIQYGEVTVDGKTTYLLRRDVVC